MTKKTVDPQLLNELLTRSITAIYPSKKALEEELLSGRKLKIYVGIDPTADYVHLGHSTNYILLKRFHELGHQIIVLVGDFTAKIGDPSDKSASRAKLTDKEVKQNLKTFKDQIGKILNFKDRRNPVQFKFNSKWLARLKFEDLVELASNFTVQQMVERDAFEKRLAENKPLYVHEFFYPLMQGYDSVALDVDMEIGGTDQTFNMLAGRTLLKRYKDKEKFVITTSLLENPVTGEKLMSKSLGTGVGLNETPDEMFGKIMALPDEGIIQCFIDCTYLDLAEITELKQRMEKGDNPRDIKLRLAYEIVEMYHLEEAAKTAKSNWVKQFSNKQTPTEIPVIKLAAGQTIIDALIQAEVVNSKSEARRLITQAAVKLNDKKVSEDIELNDKDIIQAGKRHFLEIKIS